MRIRAGRSLGGLAQRRDVAGGNETTAMPGQVDWPSLTSLTEPSCSSSRGGARDGCKRRDARRPRGRRLTVALPLDVVGELHRQRSKLRVRTTAKCRILERLTASPEQATPWRRVGTSQIRRESNAICGRVCLPRRCPPSGAKPPGPALTFRRADPAPPVGWARVSYRSARECPAPATRAVIG